jgi:hypothetical protein
MPSRESAVEISVHYIGPSLENGRIDLFVLSDGLRGLGRLINRVSYLLFGSEYDHKVELDEGFRGGSIVVPLHIFSEVVNRAEDILATKGMQALATLMSILGWGALPAYLTLYKLFKRKQGRPITDEDDLVRLLQGLTDMERMLFIRIYNDLEVQAAIRAVLKPLRTEGIIEFQTRRKDVVIDSVTKGDLQAADEAEESAISEIEEKVLDIEKAALVPHLAWHFSDQGRSFDAKIHDVDLWARVAKGERFGLGDRMRVELHTSFARNEAGRLTVERIIPKVIEVEHSTQPQPRLWEERSISDPPD